MVLTHPSFANPSLANIGLTEQTCVQNSNELSATYIAADIRNQMAAEFESYMPNDSRIIVTNSPGPSIHDNLL
jgi:hypothetical protein